MRIWQRPRGTDQSLSPRSVAEISVASSHVNSSLGGSEFGISARPSSLGIRWLHASATSIRRAFKNDTHYFKKHNSGCSSGIWGHSALCGEWILPKLCVELQSVDLAAPIIATPAEISCKFFPC